MYKRNKHQKIQRFSDVQTLTTRIQAQTPKSGDYFYDYKLQQAKKQQTMLEKDEFHLKYKINFADLPISALTLKGLTSKGFTKMTEIQRCVVPHALGGRDVMAASRTGSGKTLAYLIPLIQKLYRNKFMPMDGLGAIVLVPVRQLAMQVFEVLNSFTHHMQISVGLIIGGKDIKYEQQKIADMNILICTPGRLLQHLQETYGFQTNNLQMLVIDEADIMLQMGFRSTVNSILENIPKCQTLFFSATLNNQIHKLSQTCMTNPERIFLHTVNHRQLTQNSGKGEKKNIDTIYETPAKLMQYYMVVSPQDKLNVLYSFLKTHHKQKVLIFASTCKQVRFIYEAFRKFRLSSPLYELQGHQKQKKRMAIYFTFCEKKYGILVCTNIASRGLDFPMVDWVIQLDIPEDVETYVHRVGRTARFKYDGKALALVSEHEMEFVNKIKDKNIKIHKITQNPQKYFRIDSSLQSICSEHQDVKYLAQRALISYIQFVYKASNKSIFNIKKLDLESLAKSFGLQNAPNLSIQQKQSQDQDEQNQNSKKMTKIERLRMKSKLAKEKKKQQKEEEQQEEDQQQVDESEQQQNQQMVEQNDKDEAQDFLKVKTKIKLAKDEKPILTVSKNQLKKIKPEGHFQGKNKIIFDDNLNKITYDEHRIKTLLQTNEKNISKSRNFEFEIQNRLDENREIDQKDEKQRRKIRRKKIDIQKQEAKKGYSMSDKRQAVLASQGEEEDQ